MKNINVYEELGDVEKKIKNGYYRAFITFPGCLTIIDKINFEDKKIKESTEEYPFEELIIKTRSPFRIGIIYINKINVNGVLKKDKVWEFNAQEFIKAIKIICKKYKNTIIALPICGVLTQFKPEILKILNENVRDTKVIIIEK